MAIRSRPLQPGIRGWLGFFVFVRVFGTGATVFRMQGAVGRLWRLRHLHTPLVVTLRHYASGRLVAEAVLLGVSTYGLLLLARHDARTRRFWLAFLPLGAVMAVGFTLWARAETAALAPFVPAVARTPMRALASLAATIGAHAAWWLYWWRSARVRLTFGAPSSHEAPPSTMASAA